MTAAYPLAWPQGWARTRWQDRKRATFSAQGRIKTPTQDGTYKAAVGKVSIAIAMQRLDYQVKALGATMPVLSTNLSLRMDGKPKSGQSDPLDSGAACYFQLKRPTVLACDRYIRVADNIAAIAAHIDAIRRIERYGVGSIERIFEGFATLPAPDALDWRAALGIPVGTQVTPDVVQRRWRELAELHHPDRGGHPAQMATINAARDAALKALA